MINFKIYLHFFTHHYSQSEIKLVEPRQLWMFLENILHQTINILAGNLYLCVVCLLLFAFFFELYKLIGLVKHRLDSLFSNHFSHDFFGLVWSDAKEVSEFSERDVHVNAANDHNVMLDQSSFQNCVAIYSSDILMRFKTTFEILNVLWLDDFSIEHLAKHVIVRVAFNTFFFLQNSQQSGLGWTSWC